MKKSMSGNTYGASHNTYRPKSENTNSESWLADHKKLLWGIGGAVVLGTGAMILLKNKKNSDKYSDAYDGMSGLDQNAMNDLGEEDVVITTITELE